MEKIMIQEIENRRSIRKYKPDAVSKEILEHIIYSATLAPSAKNSHGNLLYIREKKKTV